MVVDDDESVQSFLLFSLSGEGFQVTIARGADQALAAIEKEVPDLFLLDIMMPGMDGFSLCKHLRENPRTAHVPILFITAYADVFSLARAKEVGAQGFLEKPIMFSELLTQIYDAFAGHFSLPTRLKYSK